METLYGYSLSATEMARDMIHPSGGGSSVSVRDIVPSGNSTLTFTSSTYHSYNVYLYNGYPWRVSDVAKNIKSLYEYSLELDTLSSIYHNSGSIRIVTTRTHIPSRCVSQDWGGVQIPYLDNVQPFVSSPGPSFTIFLEIVSSSNKILSTNGDCVRYLMPIRIGTLTTGEGWLSIRTPILNENDEVIGYYPSLIDIITNVDSIMALDGASILDISYSTVSPFSYDVSRTRFMLGSTPVEPNGSNANNGRTFKWYQLDGVALLEPSYLALSPVSISHSCASDSTFGYNCQEMRVIVEGRKSLEMVNKNGSVTLTVVPFCSYTGLGMSISQDDNTTTVMGSKLPWVGDAWITYNIQKKAIDEQKMWYDTIKSVASMGIGIAGAGATGGATAMMVPSSVASLGDAYFNQRQTEATMKNVPYGSGAPYGDIGSLYYLVTSYKPPIYITIMRYSGQPTEPTDRGLTVGYPSVGHDTIVANGYYAGEIITINTSLLFTSREIRSLIQQVRGGVQT